MTCICKPSALSKAARVQNAAMPNTTMYKKSADVPPAPVLKGLASYLRQFSYSIKRCMTKLILNVPAKRKGVISLHTWNLLEMACQLNITSSYPATAKNWGIKPNWTARPVTKVPVQEKISSMAPSPYTIPRSSLHPLYPQLYLPYCS